MYFVEKINKKPWRILNIKRKMADIDMADFLCVILRRQPGEGSEKTLQFVPAA